MKVIVDNKIPYIAGEIEKIADKVVYLPGDAFTKEEVKEACSLCSGPGLRGSTAEQPLPHVLVFCPGKWG